MRKRVTFILLLFIISLSVSAQELTPVEQLRAKFEEVESDTAKAGILCDIGYLLYSANPDSAIALCQQGIDFIIDEPPSTTRGVCLMNMGLAYSAKSEKFSALEYFLLAKDFFEKTSAKRQLSDCLINIGMAEHSLNNLDEAIDNTTTALGLADSLKNEVQKASCYQNLGLFYQDKSNFPMALEYYQKSLEIKREQKIDTRIANTLDAIAGVYKKMKETDSAFQYYEEALNLRNGINDKVGVIVSHYNIGVFFHEQKEYEKASEWYKAALTKAEEFKNPSLIGFCYDAFGNALTDMGEPQKGIQYIKKSLELREKIGDKNGYAHTLLNLTDAYFKNGDIGKATQTAKRFEDFKEHATIDDKLNMSVTMKDIWEERGNYKKAFFFLKEAEVLENIRDSLDRQEQLNDLKAKYDLSLAQKDHAIELKEKENEIKNIQVENKNFIINLYSVGLVLLLGLLSLAIYNYLQKRKAYSEVASQNIVLAEKNKKIDKNNRDLQVLNQKLAVSNNSLQQFTFAASHDLKESLRSITSFSQIIQKDSSLTSIEGPTALSNVDFIISSGKKMHKTLDDLLSYVNLNFGKEEEVEVDFKEIITGCDEAVFSDVDFAYSIENKTPFPTIVAKESLVRQLVHNILENSKEFRNKDHALVIEIGCHIKNQECEFFITDNGVGIEAKYLNYIFEPFKRLNSREKSGSGLGLAVCKKIVEMYGGEIWASSVFGKSTTISFSFPNAIKR